jgi:nucleoside-diphosphate-sugar epimerase
MLQHDEKAPAAPARVVVIGAGGFVGGAVARRARAAGVDTLALTRSDIDLLAGDAGERLARMLRPTDSFVAAAARAPCKDADMLVDNVCLARAIVSAVSRVGVAHVVNISSDAVYGDQDAPLDETSAAAPETMHGVMHLAREVMFRSASGIGRLAILRPTLLYGPADPHNGYGPNRFRRLAAEGKEIALFGEGEERRDHVLIDDVAEIAWRVLVRRSAGILNIATGTVRSFREIAAKVVALSGKPVPIRGTLRQGRMPHNGYRPFDPKATHAAFPDFRYTLLDEGLARAASSEDGR